MLCGHEKSIKTSSFTIKRNKYIYGVKITVYSPTIDPLVGAKLTP